MIYHTRHEKRSSAARRTGFFFPELREAKSIDDKIK
jgi:hypothetical protein